MRAKVAWMGRGPGFSGASSHVSRLIAGCALAVACSSHDDGASHPDGEAAEAAAYCPATLEETNGHACASSGLMCTQDFTCDDLYEQTVCTCMGARFECQDPIGLLPPGDAPRCRSNDPKKLYCPMSFGLAEGLTCNENGQSCYYVGVKCPDGVTKLNYCECGPDGFGGYVFACHVLLCNPEFDDAGLEAGEDGEPSD
jgi:hypothetical protein